MKATTREDFRMLVRADIKRHLADCLCGDFNDHMRYISDVVKRQEVPSVVDLPTAIYLARANSHCLVMQFSFDDLRSYRNNFFLDMPISKVIRILDDAFIAELCRMIREHRGVNESDLAY